MTDPIPRLNAALEGRYRIERELGAGGMATVYLADDLRHERRVAIKVLKPELAAVVGAERFLAEIRTTANLQHPHILPLFDSGDADGFLYYVMPYVEGESLRDRLDREKQLSVEEAVRIASTVAGALDSAHRSSVIHRDIKPANILLYEGQPLVADFGIARAIGAAGGGRLTETGLSLGTPHYMSPEQAAGDGFTGPATDVYSLGCVLYEMLAGEPPHSGSTAQVILGKIMTATAPLVTASRPNVPPNVEAVVARALERVPADRFASARTMAEALANPSFRLRRGEPNTERGSHWKSLSLALAVVAAVSLGGAIYAWSGSDSDSNATVLRAGLDIGDLALDPTSDVIVSRDGSTLALVGVLDQTPAIYVRASDESTFRLLPGTENASNPAFSPEADWIVYRGLGEQGLFKVSTAGGPPLAVLPPGQVTNPTGPAWTDEGIIYFRGDRGLYRISENGGDAEELWATAGADAHSPELLPGGRGVLVTNSATLSTYVFDLEARAAIQLLQQAVDPTYVETGHLLFGHPEGGLFAVPFDIGSFEVTGQPHLVVPDLLVRGVQAYYHLAANGTLVYRSGQGVATTTEELVVVGFDGQVESTGVEGASIGTPKWSPDGHHVAYHSGPLGERNIFVYDVAGTSPPRQLTFQGDNIHAVWAPDGETLAFSSARDGTLGLDLFTVDLAGDAAPAIVASLAGIQNARDWSEAGDLLFESGEIQGGTNIWVVSPGRGEPTPYIDSESDFDDVAVSPGGGWAAYQADVTSTEDVYVASYPAPGRPVRITDTGGQFPRWSPDGQALYYWTSESLEVDTLYRAEVVTEPTFATRSRSIVSVGSYLAEHWDLHPDGDRFVVARPVGATLGDPATGAAATRVHIVVNWLSEFRRLVGAS